MPGHGRTHVTQILHFSPRHNTLTVATVAMSATAPDGTTREVAIDHLPLTIGSNPDNSLCIAGDPYLSRQHCQIEAGATGLILRDLGSSNGTWWLQQPIACTAIPPEGTFVAGKTTLCYQARVTEEVVQPAHRQRCGEMLGVSVQSRELFGLIHRIAGSDATVLITGESGTGKELVARALHAQSPRTRKPLVAINCGALPANIIESELFGHERGAFTGALQQHRGVFEQAHGGTLFLDEIGEMSPDLQTRLLRVLETRAIRRVGGTIDVPVDCRIVAATHRDLAALVADGAFREDLYYRLYIVPLGIAPLRERSDDLQLLARHFLHAISADRPLAFAPDAMAALLAHPWPGNVRELRHTIERAALAVQGSVIRAQDFRFTPLSRKLPTPYACDNLRHGEQQMVHEALRQYQGNVTRAAKALGIARSTLTEKVRRLAIDLQPMRRSS